MNEQSYSVSVEPVACDRGHGSSLESMPWKIKKPLVTNDESHATLFYRVARIANGAASAETAARDILNELCRDGAWSAGRIFLKHCRPGMESRWVVTAWTASPDLPGLASGEKVAANGPVEPSLAHAAWMQDKSIATTVADFDGLHAGVAVPLRHGTRVFGALELYSVGALPMQRGLMDTLLQIGELLAQVIVREKAHRETLKQQQELLHIGRLASMGELARNLAHEVNQPLAAVVSYAGGALQLLDQGRADPEKLKRALEQVGVQAKRAANIIQEFRGFLRREDMRHEQMDLCALVRETAALMEGAVQDVGATMQLDLPEDIPAVEGDPVQLQQVLINLIYNAIESLAGADAAQRRLLIEVEADDQVEVRICDTGGGISDDMLPELFTPFLTTKPHGLGMGLPVSRSIIEFHGGRISADRNPDGGMNFRVRLPLIR